MRDAFSLVRRPFPRVLRGLGWRGHTVAAPSAGRSAVVVRLCCRSATSVARARLQRVASRQRRLGRGCEHDKLCGAHGPLECRRGEADLLPTLCGDPSCGVLIDYQGCIAGALASPSPPSLLEPDVAPAWLVVPRPLAAAMTASLVPCVPQDNGQMSSAIVRSRAAGKPAIQTLTVPRKARLWCLFGRCVCLLRRSEASIRPLWVVVMATIVRPSCPVV